MDEMNIDSGFSLLYPPGSKRPSGVDRWGENTVEDLGLEQLAWDLSIDNKYHQANKQILMELNSDVDAIGYRQEILADFLDLLPVAAGLQELLPSIAKLRYFAESGSQKIPLQETMSRLTELNTYITCVRRTQQILADAGEDIHSRGLIGLRRLLAQVTEETTFLSLEKNLPGLLAKLNTFPSITIGVNLDSELMPVEATLLEIRDKPFKGGSYFDRLLGRKTGRKPNQGIGPLHEVPHKHVEGLDARVVRINARYDPLLVPLFRDLFEILRTILVPVTTELKQYARVNVRFLFQLETEIAFYAGAVELIRRMQAAGLPMCRPQVDPIEKRSCHIQGIYNLILARRQMESDAESVHEAIILNGVEFGPSGRIFILTGPNQGGKTVYTQAIGLSQAMFQAGLFVPAESARMAPVDGIYTHFATLEKTESGVGRLAEEAARLSKIFHSITDKSLVLLNESLSSTSPGESLYLARDVVHALRLYGVRAVYATHLHELAEGLDAVNAEVDGDSRVISLVAGVALEAGEEGIETDSARPTYKIEPAPPRGLSYAKGIAVRYGISFEQLTENWRQGQKDSHKH
jgi:DNA mismatch repair protein MutS